MRRLILLAALAALSVLAAIPAVAGAAPVQIGIGDKPWVFVDRQGTTHVAWLVRNSPLSDTIHYRRRPAGASAFGPDTPLPGSIGNDFVGPQILQEPAPSNRLLIVGTRSLTNEPLTYVLTSDNGGVSWSGPSPVYELTPAVNPTNGRVATAAASSQGLLLVNGNPDTRLVTVPPALAPPVPRTAEVPLTSLPYDSSVALDASGGPVFSFGDLNRTFVRQGMSGPDLLAGNYPNIGNSGIKIAGGPRGVAAVVLGGIPVRRNFLVSRKLVNGALTPPVTLTAAADDTPGVPFLSADASGRFHLVWRSEGTRLLYRRSEDGLRWGPTSVLATSIQIFDPVVSAGPDGRGWVVWEAPTLSGTQRILAIALDDPSVPDTSGIPNPVVTRKGPSIYVTPRRPALRTLRKRKCVNVRVQSTQPARIRVAIFSGRRSIRIFGATVVRFTKPGKRLVCIKVPLRAHTFDVRQPFRFAFAAKAGAKPRRGEGPGRLTVTRFTNFR